MVITMLLQKIALQVDLQLLLEKFHSLVIGVRRKSKPFKIRGPFLVTRSKKIWVITQPLMVLLVT